MKIIREFVKFLDGRLAAITVVTVIFGFGAAHWNGLRLATDSSGEFLSGPIGYEVGFSQAVWSTQLIVIAAALIAGLATIFKIGEYKRIAIQLALASVIFAALNIAVLLIWPHSV